MKKIPFIVFLLFLMISSTRSGYSQSKQLLAIIDSITIKDLNYNLDSNLTNINKPYPLILIDGNMVAREKLGNFSMEDIKSIKAIPKSDSLAFQLFDKNAWGGFIIIETNLSKRKIKRKL